MWRVVRAAHRDVDQVNAHVLHGRQKQQGLLQALVQGVIGIHAKAMDIGQCMRMRHRHARPQHLGIGQGRVRLERQKVNR
jgi:hypothetical protein